MKSVWRKHLIICLVLGLLAIPVYFLDRALLSGGGGGWINLDFRGLIFRTYVFVIGIDVLLSSIAVLLFRNKKIWLIHFGSIVLAAVLLVTGLVVYGTLRRASISNEYRTMMAKRRPLVNVIELKKWWYLPNQNQPTEIRVSVVTHQAGRFAGSVSGERTDSSGSSTTVFQDTNGPETQRHVSEGEAFTYSFPLEFLNADRADDVRITLYLFKAASGPAAGDIEKIFMKSPQSDDDGEYFYGVLPPPSQPDN